MNKLFLLLGGNQGNVRLQFKQVLKALEDRVGKMLNQSHLYESEPWGFESSEMFLNQVLEMETNLRPIEVLDITQEIEKEIGRKEKTVGEGYSSRLIDIDILFYDEQIIETDRLIIPHPRLHLRNFTLDPLLELCPNFRHPVLAQSMVDLRKTSPDECQCKKLNDTMKKLSTEELKRISTEEFKQTEKSPFVVVLDNIRSMNNVGSVFRTSDAFLVNSVYLCGITAQPPHNDIHKTALGATESVDWKYFEFTIDAVEELKSEGYTIVAIEQTSNSLMLNEFKLDKSKKYAFVLGHEVKGVHQSIIDVSDFALEIPQFGTKHSFNISVTTGIVLWEVFKQYRF